MSGQDELLFNIYHLSGGAPSSHDSLQISLQMDGCVCPKKGQSYTKEDLVSLACWDTTHFMAVSNSSTTSSESSLGPTSSRVSTTEEAPPEEEFDPLVGGQWADPDSWDPLDARGKLPAKATTTEQSGGFSGNYDCHNDQSPAVGEEAAAIKLQHSAHRIMGFKLDQYLEILVARLSLDELEELTPDVIKEIATLVVNKRGIEDAPDVFAAQILLHDLAQCWMLFCKTFDPCETADLSCVASLLASDIEDNINSYVAVLRARENGNLNEEKITLQELDNMKMRKWAESIQGPNDIDDTWAISPRYFCRWREPHDSDYDGEWRSNMRQWAHGTGLVELWEENKV